MSFVASSLHTQTVLDHRQTVTVLEVEKLSHDTKRIRFELPSHAPVLGLPVGKAIRVFAPNKAKVLVFVLLVELSVGHACLTTGSCHVESDEDTRGCGRAARQG